MKKSLFLILVVLFAFSLSVYGQRILINENFEGTTWGTDSLPTGWAKFKINGPGVCTWANWAARDSGQVMCGTSNYWNYLTKAYQSKRALNIPWTASAGTLVDDWVFTDTLNIQTGDSLIFWIQLGTYPTLTYYFDSCQVLVSTQKSPSLGTKTKLATVMSLPAASNFWQNIKFSLSAFNGQTIFIAWRYYMNTSVDGIFVNIDSVFVGNRDATSIGLINANIPTEFALKQNYPNPFNPSTIICFDLPKNENVNLTVYNTLGQEVRVLVNGFYNAGSYSVEFNSLDLPTGIYLYRIKAGDFIETKKMSLIK